MKREDLVKFLVENDIPFMERKLDYKGLDQIYVFERKARELKMLHPRKYKNLFVPCIRVSHFDEERWYTRDCGWTEWKKPEEVIDMIKRMETEAS